MFKEANTVEAFLRDQLSGGIQQTIAPPGFARKGRSLLGAGWHTLALQDLPRQPNSVFIKTDLREALMFASAIVHPRNIAPAPLHPRVRHEP